MSSNVRWHTLLYVLFTVFAAGCSTKQNPPCKLSDLVAPIPLAPRSLEVVDEEAVVFSWDFPPACTPTEFTIVINRSEQLEPNFITYLIPGELRSWIASDTFTPGIDYYWRIMAGRADYYIHSDWSNPIKFYTGSLCSESSLDRIQFFNAVRLPGETELIRFTWVWPHSHCFPAGYYLEIYPDEDIYNDEDQLLAEYWIQSPDYKFIASPGLGCGDYKWRITPLGFEDMDDVETFFTPREFSHFEIYDESCEPPVSETPATIEFIYDTPCRGGPGEEFPVQCYLLEGDSAPLVGRDIEDQWWVIENPIIPDSRCWIIQTATRAIGFTSELPILYAPQLSTGTGDGSGNGSGYNPPACSGYLSAEDCKASGGTYNLNSMPPCKCP